MSSELTLERVIAEAEQLSPEDRLRLIQRVAETLLPAEQPARSRPLQFGEFNGEQMSSEEDFAIVEWRPSERELDGR